MNIAICFLNIMDGKMLLKSFPRIVNESNQTSCSTKLLHCSQPNRFSKKTFFAEKNLKNTFFPKKNFLWKKKCFKNFFSINDAAHVYWWPTKAIKRWGPTLSSFLSGKDGVRHGVWWPREYLRCPYVVPTLYLRYTYGVPTASFTVHVNFIFIFSCRHTKPP